MTLCNVPSPDRFAYQPYSAFPRHSDRGFKRKKLDKTCIILDLPSKLYDHTNLIVSSHRTLLFIALHTGSNLRSARAMNGDSRGILATMLQRWSRPPLSCQPCRKKKRRCDRNQPCSNCSLRSMPCEYAQSDQTVAPAVDGPSTAQSESAPL